ncbi:ribose-phosphate pyrophosphokinase [Desulfurobacterium thermolithotrophum DSM 11699]|uniref:Ribose-phosphate pyrophosphokinase n=1 Tax=Desulfurobacterium thermolithotrophum (strain DSM 11699 / BSA) TaxID=868864 RepID=F0S3X9_DESTD|nr:ribose-phosphate pyrophosphokinase [Desulfurobacterium thermolithotrophum]ADY73551.1 ribose-phosphate pyrophosphokinase [Desulfurobacterium thermolithotrophum DSM 11699]
MKQVKLITGSSNPQLARAISGNLGIPLADVTVGRFSDGEVQVVINESVRDCDVYIIQSLCYPANDNIMELLLIADALRRASAGRITAVIPYYAYGRQDRKVNPRDPISAKLLADILTVSGINHVVVIDLHARQVEGFFDIPVDHLQARPVLSEYFLSVGLGGDDTVVVSPDIGGVARARNFAKVLGSPIAIIDKRRPKPNVAEVMNIIGEVEGKRAVIIDDIIDTAGTIVNAARAIKERGAKEVYTACTHPVFSGPAVERLSEAVKEGVIKEVVVTDTIPLREKFEGVKVLSVSGMIAEAIRRIHFGKSISRMFDF